MVQVLVNLLVNAADAVAEEGGEIRISTRIDGSAEEPEVTIAVADDGCGISPQDLDKIYEPFFTTKDQGGTGLGLSVVWGIIEEHGGGIDVSSQVDVGTTFTIHLPVKAPPERVEAEVPGDARA
jgi:two-component system NtrC family sensor kinase